MNNEYKTPKKFKQFKINVPLLLLLNGLFKWFEDDIFMNAP
jgi:hypothetical protein